MSLENDLHEVKAKLAKDQNLLVNAFRLESFYRKYKIWIFIIIGLLVAFALYQGIILYINHHKQEKTNKIANELARTNLTQEERATQMQKLQEQNPELYDFYRYVELQNLNGLELKEEKNLEILKGIMDSKHPLIAALATYQYASLTQNLDMLENFNANVSHVLRDRARFQAAYLYIQQNNIAKAHEILNSISLRENNQYIYQMANQLKHYGIQQTNKIQTHSATINTTDMQQSPKNSPQSVLQTKEDSME
ncbi:hypothetical protein [Helicobacter didelphidarum]|uniref:hypothetical protein n=1 Tax=Helicobacter didelphidarum TaxID=2040648 RepID=UPI0015F12A69|nr:hypothetical protein [Helicobacter didelphidarum]